MKNSVLTVRQNYHDVNYSVGVDADEERLSKVISELSGKNIDEVLAEGKEKLASVPSGGAVAAGGAAAAGGADAPAEECFIAAIII